MSVEAEVISSVCKNKDIATLLQRPDVDELFRSHRDIWFGLKSYYKKYQEVPSVQILEDKFRNFESTDTSGPTKFYLDKLNEDYINQNIRQVLLASGQALKSESPSRVLEHLKKAVNDISANSRVVRDLDITDYEAAEKHFDRVRQMSTDMGGSPGIRTGIKAIDSAYPSGFAAGDLIYMIGMTGKSKTWMALYLACKAWEQGFSPMIFSLEMSPEQVRDRIYGLLGSGLFRVSQLQKGFVNIEDLREWGEKVLANGPPFTVISNEGVGVVTPDVIKAKYDQYQPDLVIFDYLQLGSDNNKSRNMIERYTNLTHELKQLASNIAKPLIVISAVTDSDETEDDTPPRLRQVAWSKAIQYDASLSLSVHKKNDTDIIEVYGEKNRFGPQFTFYLRTDLDRGIIEEIYDLET